MAINFKGDIEEIRNNYARFRQEKPYSEDIVSAELKAHGQAYNAALSNLNGCETTRCSGTFIGQASNNPALLSFAGDFNRLFAEAITSPAKGVPAR